MECIHFMSSISRKANIHLGQLTQTCINYQTTTQTHEFSNQNASLVIEQNNQHLIKQNHRFESYKQSLTIETKGMYAINYFSSLV
jgi:hypothetical protein